MKLFGTDGVRGKANIDAMTPETITKLAQATAHLIKAKTIHHEYGDHKFSVVIGKDTRLSGYMVESALIAGFVSMGANVILLGPLPTPGVAILTRSLRAQLGVVISASHNHYDDNGIKFFDGDGFKLSLEFENIIEDLVSNKVIPLVPSIQIGKAKRLDDAAGRYIEFAKATFPRGQRLEGVKIVVDCANGAAYKVAPKIFWELGAEVIAIANEPSGSNINLNCGATHTNFIRSKVLEHQADLGICLDGDADRLIMIDENGAILDGDQLLALIATLWVENNRMQSRCVVGTVMSNIGLERYLQSIDIELHRSSVGDKYVLEMMQQKNCNLGGEQSGHIILSDYSTTGDGIIAALQILSLMRSKNWRASDMQKTFKPLPQILENIKTCIKIDLNTDKIQSAIHKAEKILNPAGGRLLVRPSGTESLIRIMAQGDNREVLNQVIKDLSYVINDSDEMKKCF
jgi:phosphoglucosamine mutase